MKRLPMLMLLVMLAVPAPLLAAGIEDNIYNPGELPPTDSELKVSVGQQAPDFSLPSISGETVSLSDYKGRKNVMLTFIPAEPAAQGV